MKASLSLPMLALAIVSLSGCSKQVPVPPASAVGPSLSAEQMVLQHVHKSFADPSVVRVLSWGPHDETGELALDRHRAARIRLMDVREPPSGSDNALQIIRIVYQRPTTADEKRMAKALGVTSPLAETMTMDQLYFLHDGRVLGSEDSAHGEHWKAAMKQRIDAAR